MSSPARTLRRSSQGTVRVREDGKTRIGPPDGTALLAPGSPDTMARRTVVEWRHGTTHLAGTAAAHRGARWTLLEHEGFDGPQPPARCREETRQAMSFSIATLLTRNLHDVFGENDPARRRAAIDELFTEDGVFYDPSGGVYRGRDATRSIASRARSGRRTRTFAISPSPSPRKSAMACGSNRSKSA